MRHRRDAQLLRQIHLGDTAGVVALYDRYGSECMGLAAQMVPGVPATEDAVFSVFCELWANPPARIPSMRRWLLMETRRVCRIWQARAARMQRIISD